MSQAAVDTYISALLLLIQVTTATLFSGADLNVQSQATKTCT